MKRIINTTLIVYNSIITLYNNVIIILQYNNIINRYFPYRLLKFHEPMHVGILFFLS